MFTKGQLVECVEDRDLPHPPVPEGWAGWADWEHVLTKGAIYTVARSGIDPDDGASVVLLYEVPRRSWNDVGFYASRFRPLQDSRLDVFRAMLVQTPAPVFVPSIFVHNGDDGA